jgi:hypothetical protein
MLPIGFLADMPIYRLINRYFHLSAKKPIFDNMISVITGDIINSRKQINSKKWLASLKRVLSVYGKSPKVWEIYRGDSFQVEIKNPEESFLAAVQIKAGIKSVKDLDVRMAIGVGKKTFNASRITESNGEAFINSGEMFESIKKNKQTLAIKTPWSEIDKELNLIISLASITMDKWTPFSAELVSKSLQFNTSSQKDLARIIKITQSSISERQSRAYYREIMEAENFIHQKIKQKIS